jgi:hypothetical protein
MVAVVAGLLMYGYFWVADRAFERVKQAAIRNLNERTSAIQNAFRLVGFWGALFAVGSQLPLQVWPPH